MCNLINKTISIFFVIFLISTNLANADSALKREGFYIGGLVGLNQLNDLNFDLPYYHKPNVSYDFDTDYNIGIQIGYKFGNGFRTDLGLNYSQSEGQYNVNDYWSRLFAGAALNGTEELSNTSLMMNGYYDFINKSRITPYFGAGVGVSYLRGDSVKLVGYTGPGCFSSGAAAPTVCVDPAPPHLSISRGHNETVLTYSLMTGVNFDIYRNFTLGLEYKYLSTVNANFSSLDFDYDNHNIDLKLSYHF